MQAAAESENFYLYLKISHIGDPRYSIKCLSIVYLLSFVTTSTAVADLIFVIGIYFF